MLEKHNLEKHNLEEHNNSPVYFLIEFRSRLIYVLITFFLSFAILLCFANVLYQWLALPLLKFLPQGHLIATQIISPFFVPFKLALMVSLIIIIPFLFYQLWAFIAPALYGHERRLIWPYLWASILLFYGGIVFAYFVIFPMLFHFLSQVGPEGVVFSPDISDYLDFTMKLLFIFGLLFEIPVAMSLLISIGWVTRKRFIHMRSYAIVGAFILGMLFSPPDVLSQTLLAIPIWLLYEAGILFSGWQIGR